MAMASTKADRVSRLRENPNSVRKKNVPTNVKVYGKQLGEIRTALAELDGRGKFIEFTVK